MSLAWIAEDTGSGPCAVSNAATGSTTPFCLTARLHAVRFTNSFEPPRPVSADFYGSLRQEVPGHLFFDGSSSAYQSGIGGASRSRQGSPTFDLNIEIEDADVRNERPARGVGARDHTAIRWGKRFHSLPRVSKSPGKTFSVHRSSSISRAVRMPNRPGDTRKGAARVVWKV